jgi:hypothetical protein
MLFSKLITLTALIASVSAASLTEFANEKSVGIRIPNVYAIHFPLGADGDKILKDHFAKLGLPYTVRVKQAGKKVANFYSISVDAKHCEYCSLSFFLFFFFLFFLSFFIVVWVSRFGASSFLSEDCKQTAQSYLKDALTV